MAKSDVLVRMRADTSGYDANIAKARKTLDRFKEDNLTLGGALKQTTSSLVTQAAKFTSLGAAVGAAMKVVKDAFAASESSVDEWGRTLEAGKSVYQSFLQTINSGDFSGFVSGLGDVVAKAREAYNALDELQTRMTIINPERIAIQAKQTELKATIRRAGADSPEGRAAQQQLLALEPKLQQSYMTEAGLNWKAFSTKVDQMLANAKITLTAAERKDLMRTFYSDTAYEQFRAGASGSVKSRWVPGTGWGGLDQTNDTRNLNQKLLDVFTDEWRKSNQSLISAAFSAYGNSQSVLLGDARYVKSGGGGGGGGKGGSGNTPKAEALPEGLERVDGVLINETMPSLKMLQQQLSSFKNALENATTQGQWQRATGGIARTERAIGAQPMALELGISIDEAQWRQTMNDAIDEMREDLKPLEIKTTLPDAGKATGASWQEAARAIASAGNALQSIDDPSAKIAGLVGQAIANVALGFAMATAKDTKLGVFGWIAAIAGGLATMVTTIAQIKAVTAGSYEQGGIVPGNSYHGDHLTAAVNSGEVILNRAQAANIAGQLTAGEGNGQGRQPYVSGEQIYLGVSNYLKRSGRGEIVTTR